MNEQKTISAVMEVEFCDIRLSYNTQCILLIHVLHKYRLRTCTQYSIKQRVYSPSFICNFTRLVLGHFRKLQYRSTIAQNQILVLALRTLYPFLHSYQGTLYFSTCTHVAVLVLQI